VLGLGAAAIATLGAALAIGRPEPIVLALVLLGSAYAVILMLDDPPLDGRSAIVGAALLAIGELAHLSLQARAAVTPEAGALARRVSSVAVLAMLALALGGAVLALVDLLRTGGIEIEVVGVVAALGAIGLLVLAARDARSTSD
jgi:hypothetical protein